MVAQTEKRLDCWKKWLLSFRRDRENGICFLICYK